MKLFGDWEAVKSSKKQEFLFFSKVKLFIFAISNMMTISLGVYIAV